MTFDNDLHASIENDAKQPYFELYHVTDYEFTLNGEKFMADYDIKTYPYELKDDEFQIIQLHKEDENGDLIPATNEEILMVEKWLGE